MREVVRLKKNGLDAMDLIALFVTQRIQPLQARARGMWTYTGSDDDTRYSNAEMLQEEFEHKMKIITSVMHAAQMAVRVRPLDNAHPPSLVSSYILTVLVPLDVFCKFHPDLVILFIFRQIFLHLRFRWLLNTLLIRPKRIYNF